MYINHQRNVLVLLGTSLASLDNSHIILLEVHFEDHCVHHVNDTDNFLHRMYLFSFLAYQKSQVFFSITTLYPWHKHTIISPSQSAIFFSPGIQSAKCIQNSAQKFVLNIKTGALLCLPKKKKSLCHNLPPILWQKLLLGKSSPLQYKIRSWWAVRKVFL